MFLKEREMRCRSFKSVKFRTVERAVQSTMSHCGLQTEVIWVWMLSEHVEESRKCAGLCGSAGLCRAVFLQVMLFGFLCSPVYQGRYQVFRKGWVLGTWKTGSLWGVGLDNQDSAWKIRAIGWGGTFLKLASGTATCLYNSGWLGVWGVVFLFYFEFFFFPS